jgi:hypothetical protein
MLARPHAIPTLHRIAKDKVQQLRGLCIDRQRVDAIVHQTFHRGINHSVALQRKLAGEGGTDDSYVEVTLAGIAVGRVLVAFVHHLKLGGRECRFQQLADLLRHRLAGYRFIHAVGSVLRNGRTLTSA